VSFTYSKDDRILKRREFLRISHEGQRAQNRLFIVNACPGVSQKSRLGVTVTKRVGKAVTRNRIKRLCREFFRTNRFRMPRPMDLSIIARHEAAAAPNTEIVLSLKRLFDRLSHGRD